MTQNLPKCLRREKRKMRKPNVTKPRQRQSEAQRGSSSMETAISETITLGLRTTAPWQIFTPPPPVPVATREVTTRGHHLRTSNVSFAKAGTTLNFALKGKSND